MDLKTLNNIPVEKRKKMADKYNSCTRKIRFFREELALEGISKMKNNSKYLSPDTLSVYFCSYCYGWHIGNTYDK